MAAIFDRLRKLRPSEQEHARDELEAKREQDLSLLLTILGEDVPQEVALQYLEGANYDIATAVNQYFSALASTGEEHNAVRAGHPIFLGQFGKNGCLGIVGDYATLTHRNDLAFAVTLWKRDGSSGEFFRNGDVVTIELSENWLRVSKLTKHLWWKQPNHKSDFAKFIIRGLRGLEPLTLGEPFYLDSLAYPKKLMTLREQVPLDINVSDVVGMHRSFIGLSKKAKTSEGDGRLHSSPRLFFVASPIPEEAFRPFVGGATASPQPSIRPAPAVTAAAAGSATLASSSSSSSIPSSAPSASSSSASVSYSTSSSSPSTLVSISAAATTTTDLSSLPSTIAAARTTSTAPHLSSLSSVSARSPPRSPPPYPPPSHSQPRSSNSASPSLTAPRPPLSPHQSGRDRIAGADPTILEYTTADTARTSSLNINNNKNNSNDVVNARGGGPVMSSSIISPSDSRVRTMQEALGGSVAVSELLRLLEGAAGNVERATEHFFLEQEQQAVQQQQQARKGKKVKSNKKSVYAGERQQNTQSHYAGDSVAEERTHSRSSSRDKGSLAVSARPASTVLIPLEQEGESPLGQRRELEQVPSSTHAKRKLELQSEDRYVEEQSPLFGTPPSSSSSLLRTASSVIDGSELSIADFEMISVLGRGSFGAVMLVRYRVDGRVFAIKVLKKSSMDLQDQQNAQRERQILQRISHPYVCSLTFAFQTNERLYLGMKFYAAGDLFYHLNARGSLPVELAAFYTAEIVLALEYLHSLDILYRDLKPANIMIDGDGHIGLVDFGLSRPHIVGQAHGAHTLSGTAEYVAPESLVQYADGKRQYGKAFDWWSLGVVLYEMLQGESPFYDENELKMLNRIVYDEVSYPSSLPRPAVSLLRGLLQKDPALRLGVRGGVREIKEHPFFVSIAWDQLARRELEAPWKPTLAHDADTRYIDPEFKEEPLWELYSNVSVRHHSDDDEDEEEEDEEEEEEGEKNVAHNRSGAHRGTAADKSAEKGSGLGSVKKAKKK